MIYLRLVLQILAIAPALLGFLNLNITFGIILLRLKLVAVILGKILGKIGAQEV